MNHIDKVKSKATLGRVKPAASHSAKHVAQNKQADSLVLSKEAKDAIEVAKFVDMLRKMPDVRSFVLEKEFDFSTPSIFKDVAKKIVADL